MAIGLFVGNSYPWALLCVASASVVNEDDRPGNADSLATKVFSWQSTDTNVVKYNKHVYIAVYIYTHLSLYIHIYIFIYLYTYMYMSTYIYI